MQGLAEILILVVVLAVFAGVFLFSGRKRSEAGGGCCARFQAPATEVAARQCDSNSAPSSPRAGSPNGSCH